MPRTVAIQSITAYVNQDLQMDLKFGRTYVDLHTACVCMGPAVATINDNHVTDVILVVVIKYWFSVVGPLLVYGVVSQRVLWTLTQDVPGQTVGEHTGPVCPARSSTAC